MGSGFATHVLGIAGCGVLLILSFSSPLVVTQVDYCEACREVGIQCADAAPEGWRATLRREVERARSEGRALTEEELVRVLACLPSGERGEFVAQIEWDEPTGSRTRAAP